MKRKSELALDFPLAKKREGDGEVGFHEGDLDLP